MASDSDIAQVVVERGVVSLTVCGVAVAAWHDPAFQRRAEMLRDQVNAASDIGYANKLRHKIRRLQEKVRGLEQDIATLRQRYGRDPVARRQLSMVSSAYLSLRDELFNGTGGENTLRSRMRKAMSRHKRATVVAVLAREQDSGR